jgi:hypothetical protein
MSEEDKSEREKLAQNVFIGLLVGLFLMIFFRRELSNRACQSLRAFRAIDE